MKLKIYERDDDSVIVCCSCGHNIRNGKGGCRCELDSHSIGYVANFVQWCRHWEKDKKRDEVTE